MRFLLFAGVAAVFAAAGAPAQLQINGGQVPTVNPWDALTGAFGKTVRTEGCAEEPCTIEAIVLDNQAVGDCLEEVTAMDGYYTVDGRLTYAAEVALKIDAQAIAATRYYRGLIRMPGPGPQRLCVRRSMTVAGMRYDFGIDRPESAEQLAQATRVSMLQNRSAIEMRLAPFLAERANRASLNRRDADPAELIFQSRGTMPIAMSVRSIGSRLPISLAGRQIGATDKSLTVQPRLIPDITVMRDGKATPIADCKPSVEGALLVVTC
ncbi:MAG: hypothetical protein J0G94_05085 [Sphingomonadales bacterium]|nr:hypothetical protein [Sphingomonadales bacterium]